MSVPNLDDPVQLNSTFVLGESYRDEVVKLILSYEEQYTKIGISTDLFFRNLDKYFDTNNPTKYLFGWINESKELQAVMGLHLWPALPYATLNYMFTKKSDETFNAYRNGLVFCLHKALHTGESKGIRACYSVQRYRGIRHKSRSWRAFDTPLIKKYLTILEAKILKNTVPKYLIFQELLDNRIWPYDLGIWCTRLKPEHEALVNA